MATAHTPHDFFRVTTPQPHPATTKRLLATHPELRRLIGTNIWSALITLLLVAGQVSIAVALVRFHAPWWALLAVAWLVGSSFDHALWVMIHEATHNLVSRRRWINLLVGYGANAPMIVPGFSFFQLYHLRHHSFQGEYVDDADLPGELEARLIGNSTPAKALWLLFFPIWQSFRPLHMQPPEFLQRAMVINFLIQAAFVALVVQFVGAPAVWYLLASLFFSLGLHPYGARWIQEHYTLTPEQETYSYYGPANVLAFNVGYHNEHHDFPSVPWNRLPVIKATAPEHYDALMAHRSWSRLLLQFLLDARFSLFSRVVRPGRRAAAPAAIVPAVLLAIVASCLAFNAPKAHATGRGLEFGVDGGYELAFTPGLARVTHFHFPFGYLSYEPAMRVGVPFAGHFQLETGLGVDEFTPHDTTGLGIDDLLPHDTGHVSHWRGRICAVYDLPGRDPARRGFVRLGPLVNARHYHGRTRLQFGGTGAIGLRLPIVTHLGGRVELAYSRLEGTEDLPQEDVFALHVGMTGFTR